MKQTLAQWEPQGSQNWYVKPNLHKILLSRGSLLRNFVKDSTHERVMPKRLAFQCINILEKANKMNPQVSGKLQFDQ